MSLLTEEQTIRLLINGQPENRDKDHVPVVKLVLPDAQASWLLTWLDPTDVNMAFGLCDIGLGFPVTDRISISKLNNVKGVTGMQVEQDTTFQPTQRFSLFQKAASVLGFITDDPRVITSATNQEVKQQYPKL